MDKVRAFLTVVWQQRFWVLSAVGLLAAVICWSLAASKLDAEFTANKASINGKFGEIQAIKSKSVHGNEAVNAKERTEADKIAAAVRALWQRLYDHQREQVLKWPEELGKDFLAYIENRKFDSPIDSRWRDRYLNYIKTQFDALVAVVDAQKIPDDTAVAGPGEGRGMVMPAIDPTMAVPDFTVMWADQAMLRQKLRFPSQPTARQIWVTQEDLWVYRTLLNVIKNTNDEKNATRIDNAAIKVIQTLEVGPAAATAMAVESAILLPAAAAEAGMPTEGGVGAPEGYGRGEGGYGGAEGGAESIDAALLMNRYVDAEGKPITDGAAAPTGEYRRLPVRMLLVMDQKWVPTVLVHCANSALPIEVQRLKINAAKSGVDKENKPFDLPGAAAAMPGGGYGGGYGGIGRGEGGYGGGGGIGRGEGGYGGGGGIGRGGGGYGGGYGGEAMALNPADLASMGNVATVEIQGLVYIYNAPDDAVLSVPGGEGAATGTDALAAVQ